MTAPQDDCAPVAANDQGAKCNANPSVGDPESSTEAPIAFTVWPDATARAKAEMSMSWSGLCDLVWREPTRPAKDRCRWIKLARFGAVATPKGSLRHDANVLEVTGVEGDHDSGTMTPEGALEILERHHLRACIYTSWSHTPERPRWRVLAPLSRPVAPVDRLAHAEALNGLLDGCLAPESGVLSQSYFFGRNSNAEYKVLVAFDDPDEGVCLDELDAWQSHRRPFDQKKAKPETPSAAAGEQKTQDDLLAELLEGEEVHPNACRIVGRMVREGLSDSTIRTVFQGLALKIAEIRGKERAADLTGGELTRMIEGARAKGYDKPKSAVKADMDAFLNRIRSEQAPPIDPTGPETPIQPQAAETPLQGQPPGTPPPGAPVASQPRPVIRFTPVCDLLEQPAPLSWLIRGYLLPGMQSLVFGDPAVGKSLLTLSWAASIAIGREWHGHKVRQGTVVYVAGEGHHGIRRRLLAWALANECLGPLRLAPLFVSDSGADLTEAASLEVVIAVVDGIARMAGPPVLVCVDTLHRCIGGRDDSSSVDMGLYTQATDALIQRYGCTVLTVHHAGHGDKTRSRGSSAIRGAMDAEFCLFEQGGIRNLTATKMKDAPKPPAMAFELEQVELPWVDDEGEPETSVVLVETQSTGAAARKSVTPTQRMAFEALLAAIDESGFAPPDHIAETLPEGARLVGLESWRHEVYARHMGDSPDAKKKAFQRARADLAGLGAVGHRDDAYWIIPGCGGVSELHGILSSHAIVRGLRKVRDAA